MDSVNEDMTVSVPQSFRLDVDAAPQAFPAGVSGTLPASAAAATASTSGRDGSAAEQYPRAANDRELPALFMEQMPDGQHPDMAAMDTMMGELTPLERAENARVRGSECACTHRDRAPSAPSSYTGHMLEVH